ncbi:MAG TPA: coproporphyrinogen-III oxidase family protein [Coriobacteriia bacterium]
MLAADPGDSGPTIPPVSLYVHVPFCVSKCAYCDFHSLPRSGDASADVAEHRAFAEAVLREMDERPALRGILGDVPTLYFGGGTPTVMGPVLVDLLRGVRERVRLRPDAEITVETNPDTTEPALVAALVEAGANRFSLGVQSFDDRVLRTLGRCHNAARAAAACSALVRSGADFSVDLMCGVPGQTIESWRETLDRASMTGALHASVYPLALEPGTPMAAAVAEGSLSAPDPDLAAEMMLLAREHMAYHALDRYEVANYAYRGHESRHNTVYWTGGAYLGIGPAAASMLPLELYRASGLRVGGPGAPDAEVVPEDAVGGRVRFTLPRDTDAFLREGFDCVGAPHDGVDPEYLTAEESAREDVMLGLRLVRGVPADQVEAAGLTPVLRRLGADGLVELVEPPKAPGSGPGVGSSWRTTERGWLLGNEVFSAVWAGE